MTPSLRIFAIAGWLLGLTGTGHADFRSDLAKQFNADPQYFILNLPPRPGGWPGTIYSADMRFVVERGVSADPRLERGPPFDLSANFDLELSGQAHAGLERFFGVSANAANIATAGVTFRKARIYDLTIAELRERARAKIPSGSSDASGPLLVYRAYEGIPVLNLVRRAGADAEAWAKLKTGVVDAGFSAAAVKGDGLHVESAEPVIFAFEVIRAEDLKRLETAFSDNVAGGDKIQRAALDLTVSAFLSEKLGGKLGIRQVQAAEFEKASPTPTPTLTPDDLKALQPVLYATNRVIKNDSPLVLASFTHDRSMSMKYGLTIVGIPKNHTIGNVERPKLLILPSAIHLSLLYEQESDKNHFRIRSLTTLGREQFVEKLRGTSDSVLLFIHGYNVPFQDAIFKAAQIAYDANFSGTVLVFSWPSAGAVLGYDHDRESAMFSSEDLLKVLRILSEEIGKKRVFVLAHSLGNEILVNALQQAAIGKTSLRISELMFAAPDVDKDVFLKKADDIKAVAKNMTLYASSADKALLASKEKAWGSRMGYVGAEGPNVVKGIETLDVTAVGDDMLGLNHGTYSARAVLEDIGHLIMSREGQHLKPHERLTTLKFVPDAANVKYWRFPE